MRLSTANAYDAAIANLQRRQQDLSDSQEQMASLKRVNRASDDPSAAARAERALALESRSRASQRAVEASRNAMALTESTLGDAVNLLQQARDTLVAAGNASYSDAERLSLAKSLREVRGQLLMIANRPDGSGNHIFAGQGASSPPFADTPAGVVWRGVPGQSEVVPGDTLPLTLDGQATWTAAPSGNGVFEARVVQQQGTAWIDAGRVTDPQALTGDAYTLSFDVTGGVTSYSVLRAGNPTALANVPYESGKAIEIDGLAFTVTGAPADGDGFELAPSGPTLNVFDRLDRMAAELETPLRNGGQVAQTVAFGLRDLDGALGRLQSQRSMVGETLNRIDGAADRLDALELGAQTERSQAEDLDMVEAISKFQGQQTGYDAALKSYAMVQRLSLFQYLNV